MISQMKIQILSHCTYPINCISNVATSEVVNLRYVTRSSFCVTLQAQRSAPSDLPCKDKFLIQSTVVPLGTTEEDITSGMFVKDGGKHIEETKLRVVLISPPHSPVLLPVNGVMKQEPFYETPIQKDKMLSGMENLHPVLAKDVEDVKSARKDVEPRLVKDVDDTKLKLGKDIEELKSKLNLMESKLTEADLKITRLTDERSTNIQERETLKQELVSKYFTAACLEFLFYFTVKIFALSLPFGMGVQITR
ncbi:hypothetical protein U1Q18_030026 [Sarracenia purpurea var. burkii]